MKPKYFSYILSASILISLLTSTLVFPSVSHAQSSQSWSDPINLSNSGSSSSPSIVTDSNGVIHVIWVDAIDGYKYVKSSDGGTTWTSPETVIFPFLPDNKTQPMLVAGKAGEIHVLWRDKENTLYYARAIASTFNEPSSWTRIITLSDSVTSFDAVVSASNVLHLGYLNSLGNEIKPSGIYYQYLGRSGWSTPINLYSSKYYRSLEATDTNLSIAVSSVDDVDHVMMTWDDRSRKRIFWAKSSNGGDAWDDPLEVSGPEQLAGSEMPYNIQASTFGDTILLLWQVGIPGSRCIQYSQWSSDDGAHFEKPVKLLDDFTSCPKQSSVVTQNKDFSVSWLNLQDEISLIAWNGNRWSRLQSQKELSTFPNPLTFDNVLLGCQNASLYNETLFVVGCDTGTGGDIWFRSRPLGSLDEWFPPPSAWTSPVVVATTHQIISSLSSVADSKNNIHSFWVQTPASQTDTGESTIVYSRWDGNRWSKSANIIAGFNGIPHQLSSTIDNQGRLLLTWVEGENGDLYFSWASAEHANLASEWYKPQQLPSISQLNSSPDILVDDLGRIVVVYTVPLNEERGVYIVESTDLGQTWSQPTLLFDAVAAGWSLVNQPVVGLSTDGSLHVLFTRSSLRENDPSRGLYYSQSTDGGLTWLQPQLVSEKNITWSQIVCFDKQIIHRLWQEDNAGSMDVFDQVSHDGGINWDSAVKVSSKNNATVLTGLAETTGDQLYITQSYIEDENLIVEVHNWDGSHWVVEQQQEVNLDAKGAQSLVTTRISQQGILDVIASVVYPEAQTDLQNEVVSFSKSLDISSPNANQQPAVLQISTPSNLPSPTMSSELQVTPTELSPLSNLGQDAPSPKNTVGLILVGLIVFFIVAVVWPKRRN